MKRQIIYRFLQLLVVLLGISFLSFSLINLSPQDPAYIKLSEAGIPPSEELIEKTRQDMGLDRPFLVRYTSWLSLVIAGDFGKSYSNNEDVLKSFIPPLINTIKLTSLSFFIAIVISIPLAIFSALKRNTFIDTIIKFLSVVSMSMPDFYIGVIILLLLGLKLRLFPIIGGNDLKNMVMPSLTMGLSISGQMIKQIRQALVSQLNSDYVKGAIVHGLPDDIIIKKHVLRNASLSIITFLALNLGSLLGGTSVCEIIFNFDGVSSQVVRSISHRDIPMIQIYTLWIAGAFTLINFFVDVSYMIFSPQNKDLN